MPIRRPITDRQAEIRDAIIDLTNELGIVPSHKEIAAHVGLTASTVAGHLDRLLRKGAMVRVGGDSDDGYYLRRNLLVAGYIMRMVEEAEWLRLQQAKDLCVKLDEAERAIDKARDRDKREAAVDQRAEIIEQIRAIEWDE